MKSWVALTTALVVVVVAVGVGVAWVSGWGPWAGAPTWSRGQNTISVSGLSLCASDCGYPAPYASALIMIYGSVPPATVYVYVNGTYDGFALQNPSTATITCTGSPGKTCSLELGGKGYSNESTTVITSYYATCFVPTGSTTCVATVVGETNTLTVFAQQWKGGVPANLIPVIRGDTYVFRFNAAFQDGSTATTTALVVAT